MQPFLTNTCYLLAGIALLAISPALTFGQDIWPPPDDVVAREGYRITSIVQERFRNGSWELSKKEDHIYNAEGHLDQKQFSSRHGDEWRLTRRETYSYDDGILVTVLKEDKRVNVFHPTEQRSFHYDNDRLSTMTIDAFNPEAQLVPVFRNTFSYQDADTVQVVTIRQEQSVNGNWKYIKSITLTKDGLGRVVEGTKHESRGGVDQVVETYTFDYNDDGWMTARTWSFLGEEGWMEPFTETFTQDGNVMTIDNVRTLMGETTKSHRVIIRRDENDNVISRTYQRWRDDSYVDGRREVFSHAAN